MLRPEPPPHVDQFLVVHLALPPVRLVLSLSLKVPLEVVVQTHLLLQLVGVVLEGELLRYVLLLDSLNVVEEVLTARQDLGRVVEIDSNHVVA